MMIVQKNVYRLGIYIIGMIFVSLGIVLCVKCELGVSPISSIPYVLGYLTPLTFGTLTMVFHFLNSIVQYILEKRLFNVKVLLQIPVAFLFGVIIDFFKNIMSFQAENLIFKILLMIMSIILYSTWNAFYAFYEDCTKSAGWNGQYPCTFVEDAKSMKKDLVKLIKKSS